MTINYVGTLKADIGLDNGTFVYHGMNNSYHALQEYIDRATYLMTEYGFANAQIVDCETDEIIVEMETEYNDSSDDGPAYYDDDDTCGYE
jgi:hypothetical protein